jgi:hypothetical protein
MKPSSEELKYKNDFVSVAENVLIRIISRITPPNIVIIFQKVQDSHG